MADAKDIEKANSYRELQNLWAFKDLISEIDAQYLNRITEETHREADEKLIYLVLENRGFRKALDAIKGHISFVTSDTENLREKRWNT